jgi:hypothetical protein
LLFLLLGNVAIFLAGVITSALITTHDNAVIGASIFLIPTFNLFASFYLSRAASSRWDERAYFRVALVLAFTMLWLSLAVTITFAAQRSELPQDDRGRVVFAALTDILKFMLSFYFVAEATSQVADRILSRSRTPENRDQPPRG